MKIYTFEELKWHACHFILSKWQSFTDLYEALRADSNLQWSKMGRIFILHLFSFQTPIIYQTLENIV
jgi:hypothetical protein